MQTKPTIIRLVRSVQRAVISAPSVSLVDAVNEALRRSDGTITSKRRPPRNEPASA